MNKTVKCDLGLKGSILTEHLCILHLAAGDWCPVRDSAPTNIFLQSPGMLMNLKAEC